MNIKYMDDIVDSSYGMVIAGITILAASVLSAIIFDSWVPFYRLHFPELSGFLISSGFVVLFLARIHKNYFSVTKKERKIRRLEKSG